MAAPALDPSVEAFFNALLSDNDAVRKQAEASKEAVLQSNPAALVGQLAAALTQAPNKHHRALAAVLMRRTVDRSGTVWRALAPPAQAALKAGMLQAFVAEPEEDVRKKVCHAVAELAACASKEAGAADWPELLPAVFSMCADAAQPARRAASLFMFTSLTEFTGDRIIAPHCAQLQQILAGLIVDPVLPVAVGALKACCKMITSLEDEAQRNGFQASVPGECATAAASGGGERRPPDRPLPLPQRNGPLSPYAPLTPTPHPTPFPPHSDDQGARDDAERRAGRGRDPRMRGAAGAHLGRSGAPARHAAPH